jgi:hypothetical protein
MVGLGLYHERTEVMNMSTRSALFWDRDDGRGLRSEPLRPGEKPRAVMRLMTYAEWRAQCTGDPPLGGYEAEYRRGTPLRIEECTP